MIFEQDGLPTIAIIGRTNVGKSTLFNRLVQKRSAIVKNDPGVTRDRKTGICDWGDVIFRVVDTGGPDKIAEGIVGEKTAEQVWKSLEESDLIFFLVDVKTGPVPGDWEIVDKLRKYSEKIVLIVNKVDNEYRKEDVGVFYSFGLGEPVAVSAEHGLGIEDIIDIVRERAPDIKSSPVASPGIRVSVVGKPNVGKSSLVNAILGSERMIVSPVAGTTRDSIDTKVKINGNTFTLIDTAGIRRKSKTVSALEKYCVIMAMRSIRQCDVAVLLLDAEQSIANQDVRIGGYIKELGRSCLIAVNKWDVKPKGNKARQEFLRLLNDKMPFLAYAPVIFISALQAGNIHMIPDHISKIYERYNSKLPTSKLNEWLENALKRHHAPRLPSGKPFKIFYVSQTGIRPPAFHFIVNDSRFVHFSFERYLENRLRVQFDLTGTPVKFKWKVRKRRNIR